jgi:hypothetical protein
MQTAGPSIPVAAATSAQDDSAEPGAPSYHLQDLNSIFLVPIGGG